jgi:hypothetical protein
MEMRTMAESELLTPKECADYLRRSVRTLDRDRAEGLGCPYVRIGGRIFYRRSDLDRFIALHVRGDAGDVGGVSATNEPVLRQRGSTRAAPSTRHNAESTA